MAEEYIAAYWKVKAGREEEFVTRWRDFTGWATQNAPGAKSFTLLHNMPEPQYFISFGTWTDRDAIQAWFAMPGFAERYEQVRELCEEHVGGVHTLEALLAPVS
jgi:heme-degrading monooxygenase HmoA